MYVIFEKTLRTLRLCGEALRLAGQRVLGFGLDHNRLQPGQAPPSTTSYISFDQGQKQVQRGQTQTKTSQVSQNL